MNCSFGEKSTGLDFGLWAGLLFIGKRQKLNFTETKQSFTKDHPKMCIMQHWFGLWFTVGVFSVSKPEV